MQIKEFEAFTLKECLQLVRNDLGPDAVILETRKFRKGGLLGWGARDAVCIVAGTGITVRDDLTGKRPGPERVPLAKAESAVEQGDNEEPDFSFPARARTETRLDRKPERATSVLTETREETLAGSRPTGNTAVVSAARNAYARAGAVSTPSREPAPAVSSRLSTPSTTRLPSREPVQTPEPTPVSRLTSTPPEFAWGVERMASLERTMREIRDTLTSLQKEQKASEERTVSAVVSAVVPAVTAASSLGDSPHEHDLAFTRFPELLERLLASGVSESLANDLLDSLPDLTAWSEEARLPLADTALIRLIANRLPVTGPIQLTPGRLKAVALIGPTGVGKTTTIAKLAAHYSLVEDKKVALLTVDTYRIAAVEQLKVYSQIINIPISVAYSQSEVMYAISQFADFDLLLIDTAGRSQNNISQVGELKTLLQSVNCETHLVLSAPVKESDMLDAAQRFSAARVDNLLFTKLDETRTHGTLLNVADKTGLPISYVTTGQKVPEDMEVAEGEKMARRILCLQ